MTRGLCLGVAIVAAGIAPLFAQDPPKPVVLALAKPMSAAEAAARLTGRWKLNEELSPPLRAGSSPLAAGQGGAQSGRSRNGGQGGRPVAYERERLEQERQIRVRALYREMTVAPEMLTLTVSVATAKFVDPEGLERLVNINAKKEKLDLGTTVVDSKSRWDGHALTIELEGGQDLKIVEVFELAPTGTQMLVTIRAGDEHDANTRGLRGRVERVYDRLTTAGGDVSVVEFYRGRALDSGLRLVDIWDWSFDQLDATPDYIDWMFPVVDPDTARVFIWDDVLRDRLHVSLATMLKFLGLERIVFPNGRLLVLRAASFPERRIAWVTMTSGNHQRITRMLASLRQLGLENEARALFRCLEDVYREEGRDAVDPEVFYGWRDAAGG